MTEPDPEEGWTRPDEDAVADAALRRQAMEFLDERRTLRRARAARLSHFATWSVIGGGALLLVLFVPWVAGALTTSSNEFRAGMLVALTFLVGGIFSAIIGATSLAVQGPDDDAPESPDDEPARGDPEMN